MANRRFLPPWSVEERFIFTRAAGAPLGLSEHPAECLRINNPPCAAVHKQGEPAHRGPPCRLGCAPQRRRTLLATRLQLRPAVAGSRNSQIAATRAWPRALIVANVYDCR